MKTEPSWLDVVKEMSKRNMDVQLSPIGSNFLGGQAGKKGTRITIGVAGNPLGRIVSNEMVGGLVLCDRKQFEEVEAELRKG